MKPTLVAYHWAHLGICIDAPVPYHLEDGSKIGDSEILLDTFVGKIVEID